jgi:hypothetical protein
VKTRPQFWASSGGASDAELATREGIEVAVTIEVLLVASVIASWNQSILIIPILLSIESLVKILNADAPAAHAVVRS